MLRDRMSPDSRRRRVFPMLALFLGLTPFCLLEAGLRLTGFGRPQDYSDPFVGFSRIHPLFELDREAEAYRTAPSRLQFFGQQQFSQAKPPAAIRGFCLGGSTVLGHPYQPDTAFSQWTQIELQARGDFSQCEVVNCGGISYASYRLVPIVKEVLNYQPDFLIVATGHNEFLEDRTYHAIKSRLESQRWLTDSLYSLHSVNLALQAKNRLLTSQSAKTVLPAEVDARLDHASGYASYHRDEQWRQGVLSHYRQNLHAMAHLCRGAGVKLILVNLGSNLRDCPPFKSEHQAGLEQEELLRWQENFEKASELEPSDPKEALQLYLQCQQIDRQFALVAYRIARCWDRLGEFEKAREHYNLSKDLDVCPLRMLEETHAIVQEVAEQENVPFVDARALLEEESEHRLAGSNIYLDHVHPDIFGHQLIAQQIVRQVEDSLGLKLRDWPDAQRRSAYRQQLERLGTLYLAQGRLRVEWLEDWARRDRLSEDVAPWDLRDEIEVANHYQDLGKPDEALTAYRLAITQAQSGFDMLLHRSRTLFRQGRFSEATSVAELVLQEADSGLQAEAQKMLDAIAAEKDEQ